MQQMILIQQDQLDEWGVSFLEAFEIARENLSHLDGTLTSIDNRLYIADKENSAVRVILLDPCSKEYNSSLQCQACNKNYYHYPTILGITTAKD